MKLVDTIKEVNKNAEHKLYTEWILEVAHVFEHFAMVMHAHRSNREAISNTAWTLMNERLKKLEDLHKDLIK